MSFSQSQKKNFIQSIKTEDIFRKQILLPLFENMGYAKVLETHGSSEKGKDLVLIQKNNFEQKEYTAVIIKNNNITNAASSRNSDLVSNIISQIQMTITSGYYCLDTKKQVHFNQILIVTSGKISNSAREAFVNASNQNYLSNINFLETDNIVTLLDKYLPDAYFVNNGMLSKYFNILKRNCENLNELNKISNYSGKNKKVSEIFIEPKIYRRIEYIENGSTQVKFEETILDKLINKKGYYLIKGNAGSGKSTLLRSKVIGIIGDFELNKSNKIPFYIKLKVLVRNYLNDPKQHFISFLNNEFSINLNKLDKEEQNYEYILFLDGFDELVTQKEKDIFFDILNYLKSISNTIIISSRNQMLQTNDNINKFETWKISDFSFKQISSFINKWFKTQNVTLIDNLKEHNLLEKMPNTPLVMTLLAILFDSNNNVEIPANLSELYSMFINLLLGKWNTDRRLDTFYQSNDKETFLEELAYYLHINNKTSGSKIEIFESFDATIRKLGRNFNKEKMLNEIIDETNLLCINEYGEYEFRHLSFQEYLIAKKLTIKNNINTILTNFPSPWWDQVLYYYCGIRKDNEDILPLIYNRIGDLDPKQKLLQYFNLGYLIQSSYKTDASIRKNLIYKSIKDYSKSIEDFLINIEIDHQAPTFFKKIFLVEFFNMHFKSKYLEEIYLDIYNECDFKDETDKIKTQSLLILTLILASSGKLEYLSDNDFYFKQFPDIQLLEDFFLRCDLLEDEKEKLKRKKIKEISSIISRRIRKNIPLYKNIIEQ